MSRLRVVQLVQRLALCFAALCLAACMRSQKVRFAPYRVPQFIYLYVAVSDEVARTDDQGAVSALVEAIEADLRAAGYQVQLVAARDDEPPPLPRIEIHVISSDTGDREMRGAGNLLRFGTAGLGPAIRSAGGGAATSMGIYARGTVIVDYYMLPTRQNAVFAAGRLEDKWADDDTPAKVGHAVVRAILE
jgi:hypothetical protein